MKILHATPTFFSAESIVGGGERYVNNVCVAINSFDSSIKCDILSLSNCRKTVEFTPGVKLHLLRSDESDPVSCAGPCFDLLISQYDVVHVHQCLSKWGFFVAARARMAGKIVIGSDHGGGELEGIEFFPVLGNAYHCFHAHSFFTTFSYLQMSKAVRIIRGPVDETKFFEITRPRENEHVVSIGRILPHKGFERIIDALPNCGRLTIVGRVYDNEYYEFLALRAKGKNVIFETSLDDRQVTDLLTEAGLYVHSSTHYAYDGRFFDKPELLGLAPLEAMCCGTPALVSEAGALPEIADHAVGCMTFENTAQLADMLVKQMTGELFTISAAEIRESVLSTFGLHQFGKRYVNILNKIIDGDLS